MGRKQTPVMSYNRINVICNANEVMTVRLCRVMGLNDFVVVTFRLESLVRLGVEICCLVVATLSRLLFENIFGFLYP